MWYGHLEGDWTLQIFREVQDGPQEGLPGQGDSVSFLAYMLSEAPIFMTF